jgi:hypothetical protein
MIRLHVWTIVLDLCISAEADRPAPAVVCRLRRLDREKQRLFPGSLTSDAVILRDYRDVESGRVDGFEGMLSDLVCGS